MSVFLCITIISLTVLGADFRTTIILNADVINNRYFAKFYLFGISILRVIVSVVDFNIANKYVWLKLNGKTIGVALTFDTSNKDSIVNYMSNPIINAIDFKYFDISVKLGKKNNAFISAMAVQLVRSAYNSLVAVIKSRQDLDTVEKFMMDYSGDTVKLDFYGIISLTPANIIISLMIALADKAAALLRPKKEVNFDIKHRTKTY